MRHRIAARSNRREFLRSSLAAAGTVLAAPTLIPRSVLGGGGTVAPSERIVLGAIGIGGRGSYVLGCFLHEPDVQFVAICDVKAGRRQAVKQMADAKYGNQDCAMYRDLREFLGRSDIDAVLIATGPNWHAAASILAAQAGKDVYCEKPCTKDIASSLALAKTFRRTGGVFQAGTQRRSLPNFTCAIGELHARYATGVKLIMRNDGWLPLGSCPVRFEGDTGWVETADNGDLVASSDTLLVGRGAKIGGYPADFHVRDFLDCVKSRGQTRANADVACWSHIACHAANIALFLNRKVRFDPQRTEFIDDEEANRFRSEALREPWRI